MRSRTRYLLLLPPILVLLVIGGLVAGAMGRSTVIAEGYRVQARAAIEANDLPRAKFFYSRLVGSGDRGTDQDRLNWAKIQAASGQPGDARAQLVELAPADREGYGPAHLQVARELLASVGQTPAPQRESLLRQVHHHLTHGAWQSSPENDVLWGQYHLAGQQWDEATVRLAAAAKAQPMLWHQLYNLYRQLGRPVDAAAAAEAAEAYARDRLREQPTDVAQRLIMADLLAQRGEFEAVGEILAEGLNDPRIGGDSAIALRHAASNLELIRLGRIDPAAPDADAQRLSRIAAASKWSPGNPQIVQTIAKLISEPIVSLTGGKKPDGRESSEQLADYQTTLESMVATGQNVPQSHMLLGTVAFARGDTESAIFHLETALEQDPRMIEVANNLAWVLAHQESPDLQRAEQLIKVAVTGAPKHPLVLDTQATIAMLQGHHREALPILEKLLAAASAPNKPPLHAKLAEVYEALDQPSLAAKHRELSKQSPAG